jgi:diguanylate cyclase (GGDEF)-like protein
MERTTEPGRRSWPGRVLFRTPGRRTVALAVLMAAVGLALGWHILPWHRPPGPFSLRWWQLIPVVVLADELSFHLEIRGEAHSFTLSELPLVLGCLFVAPWGVIAARLGGAAAYQVVRRRQRGVKLFFNLSVFLLETVVALILIHGLMGGRTVLDWVSWPVILAALAAADAISLTAVSCAIHWHGGSRRLGPIVAASGATAVVNVSLGLLVAVILRVEPVAIGLLGVVLGMTALAFRGYANLSKRYASLKLLYEFTEAVGANMTGEKVLGQMLDRARGLLRAETAEVVLFDRSTGLPSLRQRSTDSDPDGTLITIDGYGEKGGLSWAEAVRAGRPLLVSRTDRSPEHAKMRDELGAKDLILAPLRSEDAVVGAMVVSGRLAAVSTFDSSDTRLFETLANHASVAIENSRLVEQLRREADERRHEALHDSLTGLPNRTLFSQQVNAAAQTAGRAAVMLMDLDRFKEVNDTLGHHNGDLLLCQVSTRLVEALAGSGTAARFGGDEFAILLPDIDEVESARAIAARVLDAFGQPFLIEEMALGVGASIGIAVAPDHGSDATTLLQRADVAMYEAKANRSGAALYDAVRDTYSPRRLRLAGELRQALENDEIVAYFQPKVSLSDRQVVGAEALVRWRHPELGLLPPDEFIPVAEQTGLIIPLTHHVLRLALRQCRQWRRSGHDIGVAVNLAMRSLLDASLAATVDDLLRRSKVPASHLTLEITESSIMADADRAIRVLTGLARRGVRLSVDDFGTGYSSLTYLQRLPVHEVKIDKSFVFQVASDEADATIVQSIVELGHNLGLSVVAEGVEDQVSWDRLRGMSCDIAQGYYLSKPLPPASLTRWLVDQQPADSLLSA